jgi:hypothetical protein
MDKRTLALALVAKYRMGDVQVSRGLDRLIAEKVMGWTPLSGYWVTPDDRMVDFPETLKSDDRSESAGLPHYSTNIATAWNAFWTVAGNPYKWAIYPNHGSVEIEHYPDDYCGDREDGSGDWSVEGPLAFALCQAMLWIVDWETCK